MKRRSRFDYILTFNCTPLRMLSKKASRSSTAPAATFGCSDFLIAKGSVPPLIGGGGGGIGAPVAKAGGGGGGGGAPDAPAKTGAAGGAGGGGGMLALLLTGVVVFGFGGTCTGTTRGCTGAGLTGGGGGCFTGAYCTVVLFSLGTIVGLGGAGGATRIVPTFRCVWGAIVA